MRKREDDSGDPKEESGAHRLAALLRAGAMEAVDEQRDEVGWRALLFRAHRTDEHGARKPRRARRWIPLTVAVTLAIAVGTMFRASMLRPLTFEIDGRASSDAHVSSGPDETKRLDFSDGSTLALRPAARLRVSEMTARGAALTLERGQLDVSVRHRPATRWQLSAGPYTVTVTGTRFEVSWNPDRGEIRVNMLDGSVSVEGPGLTRPVVVAGGEHFQATEEPRGSAPTLSPPRAADVAASKGQRVANLPGSPARWSGNAGCRWDDLVAGGRFELIIRDARASGLGRVLSACPATSLFALADAARYRSEFDLSRRSLLAIRRRSPADAGKAAFLLGRVEEARGNYELALRWYSEASNARQTAAFVEEARAAEQRVSKRIPGRKTDAVP